MVIFPNCKINLGLQIVAKRADGYHDLETVFYPIPIYDALEVIEDQTLRKDELHLSGNTIEGDPEENLCVRAIKIIRNDFPSLPFLHVYLHKVIPTGAGLGGGSANGAFMLQLLNNKFHLGITGDKLKEYALHLGSDCPFFIVNSPCTAKGRGEVLIPINLSLKKLYLVIIHPGIHISTQEAFSFVQPAQSDKRIEEIIAMPIEQWKDELINDFEDSVFQQYPEIEAIKNKLYSQAAIYASMSGSGSSVYGIFKEKPLIDFGYSNTRILQLS